MNGNEQTTPASPVSVEWPGARNAAGATVTAGFFCWVAMSLGFFGLKTLMEQRPEFIGQPVTSASVQMIQESPWIVARKLSDDVSIIKPMQPESSDIQFDMSGRRDYRGLRTIMDMSGGFRGRFVLTNVFDEPLFVLFKCPHPRASGESAGNLLASGLNLEASVNGAQETSPDAWLWSGTLEPHSGASLDISYQVASLKGIAYRVGAENGNPVKHLRVTVHRQNLTSMRFESGDGPQKPEGETVSWERHNFIAPDSFSAAIVESRGVYTSLTQLLEIGPLVCLLFLSAMSAAILARQRLTTVQMCTIAAGYGLYFPLILYLSARFSFLWALVIAVVVPGALLVNYARWLLGGRFGLIGGAAFLALYWVFPTLAAFAGWNRGMVLVSLGVVTLWVLINLQNQALRLKAATATALFMLLAATGNARAGEIQVLLPAELATRAADTNHEPVPALVAFEPVHYEVRHESNAFSVEASTAFRCLRPGDAVLPLFNAPVHLQSVHVESADTNFAAIVTITNRLALFLQHPGTGNISLSYRVPIENREGKRRAQIPLLAGEPGNLQLASPRPDLEILSGSLWNRTSTGHSTAYDIGVAGEDQLVVEWRDRMDLVPPIVNQSAKTNITNITRDFYGIGLTRAQNLTVVNSDGSCTHFAEFEVPAFQAEEFRLKLPAKARLISVSVNGTEQNSPTVEDGLCRIRLPARQGQQTSHRLSFRIAYPPLRLGFMGTTELALPEVFQTAGTMEWVIALPNGFQTQVVSSGLETQRSQPDLDRFGDYGRILKSHEHIYLAKDLAPPGLISASLKYRQIVDSLSELRK